MSAPSEPEKYSIDEMMERLQSLPTEDPIEDGELVTRADGSQAIRVRKRKRRTQQPHKEALRRSRRVRMIQVSVLLALVLLAVCGVGVAVVFANSAPYREKLLREISRNSGAAVDVEQFRINPTSANAGRLSLSWPEGNVLRSLTLSTVRANLFLPSLFGNALSGEEVTSFEGTLNLRLPRTDQPARNVPAGDQKPLSIRFRRYAVQRAHVLLGNPDSPFIRMLNSECTFDPTRVPDRPQLLFYRGDITINGWPKMRMDRSHIEFRGTEVDVVGMRLLHETDNRGSFVLAGTVSPYVTDHVATLAVQLETYLFSGISGPELGRFFLGRIDTRKDAMSNFLSFTPAADPDAALSISFRKSPASSFAIKGFPFLFGLAQTLGDDWFERPVFEGEVSGLLRRKGGTVNLSDLSFEQKERMALRGTVSLAPDQKLSGTLRIGIAENTVSSARSRLLDAMFSPSQDGFRWLTLKIGGTAATPTDNFKDLYAAAGQEKKTDPSSEIPTFEDLTRPK